MSEIPKLGEREVQLMLKLSLLQKNDVLARLKAIEAMPDDGSVDKVALMAKVLNSTGAES